MNPAVRMVGITKRFGRLTACDQVDLSVEKGQTHAIVGENGAGKTTLMRVLYSVYQPDEGSIEVDGKQVRFRNPSEAIAAGIGMVSQHYSIIPQLSCLDNLMLGAEAMAGPLLDRSTATARADSLAQRMGFRFDWKAPASTLTPAACQKLEILKLLWRNSEILILDEPTAMLSPPDAAVLFNNLQLLAREGKTILLVTHRLREVIDYCDRVTVMRGGKRVAECDVADTDVDRLTNWIVGEDLRPKSDLDGRQAGKTVLTMKDLVIHGDRGERAINGLDLDLRAGEIAGIAGVDGNGQSELFEALVGIRAIQSGIARLGQDDLGQESTSRRLAAGLRFIPADRHRYGLIEDWSLLDNSVLGLHRLPPFAKRGLLRPQEVGKAALEEMEAFRIMADSVRTRAGDLSGGNQQRLIVARALHQPPAVLIAFQPCRGLDVRGTLAVYDSIRAECDRGMAALVISFDLDELLEYCEPIYVLRDGRLVAELRGLEIDRERIGRLMIGLEGAAA